MMFHKVFEPFIEKSSMSVMLRGTLENVFAAEALDEMFERTAVKQVSGELLFSVCTEIMAQVVTKTRPSVNAVYRADKENIPVSVQSVYNKLSGIEPVVSETLVRETAKKLAEVRDAIAPRATGPLPGYDVRIADGNHLAGTQHRLLPLRPLGAAALPGHTLPILNPHTELIEDLLACEDAHANQRSMLDLLLEKILPKQCWIGDSHFSIKRFLFGVKHRRAYFIVRHHPALTGEPVGRRRKLGRVETGILYEQKMRIIDDEEELVVRYLTIERDEPTQKGKTTVDLLTNLPQRVKGEHVASAYTDRWSIEAAFCKLATNLRSEINTLGYPDAALFGFSVGVVMYNALSVSLAALAAVHPLPEVEEDRDGTVKSPRYSSYYLIDELKGVWRGMEIAVARPHWEEAFGSLTAKQLAAKLKWLARRVDPERYHTHPYRKRKTKRKKTSSGYRGNHVSTHRELMKQNRPPNPQP